MRQGYTTKAEIEKVTRRIKRALFRFGYERDEEDAAQDFFVRVLEGKSQHQTIDQFVIDFLRKRYGNKRHPGGNKKSALEHADSFEQGEFDRTTADLSGEQLENRRDLIRLALRAGKDQDADILWLFRVEGFNETEIADHYKISPSRVSQRLKRVQSRLSERIKKEAGYPRKGKTELESILSFKIERMEFEPNTRVALEEPGAMEAIDGQSFEEWIA